MGAFLSSQPALCRASRKHRGGFMAARPLPQAAAHAGGGWWAGGGIREAARMETRGRPRQRTFGLFPGFLCGSSAPRRRLPRSRLDRVNPPGCPHPFLSVPLLLGCSPAGLRSGPIPQVAGGLISLNLMPGTAGRKSEGSQRRLPFSFVKTPSSALGAARGDSVLIQDIGLTWSLKAFS